LPTKTTISRDFPFEVNLSTAMKEVIKELKDAVGKIKDSN
jgi:hypothetical protein